MKTVVIEGWRFIPHSYAMVTQHLCLEILRRGDIGLHFRDVPFAYPTWRPETGVFEAEDEARLRGIPEPPAGLRPDAVLRMGWPHFFHKDPEAGETFTWVTSEALRVEDGAIGAKRAAREVLPGAESRVIACSRWAAQGFINSGLPAERVSVVPCGIDPGLCRPATAEERAALRQKFGWGGKLVVLNVSAMTGNKGIPILLKAGAALGAAFPSLAIVLKGSDMLYSSGARAQAAFKLLTPAEAQMVGPRVTYAGKTLTTGEMVQMYQAADLYVSPYMAEGFNMPVLEAGACGCPVVCTAGGSTEDFVDESWAWKIASTLVENPPSYPGKSLRPNLDHLIGLMRMSLANEGLRRGKGAAGAEWARSRFTWAQAAEKMLGVMFPGGLA